MHKENRMKAQEEAKRQAQEAMASLDEETVEETTAAEAGETAEQADAAEHTETQEKSEELLKLEAEVKAKEALAEEAKNRLLRLQADFDNFRRRKAEEQERLSQFVTASVSKEFLKVLDNFERAEASLEQAKDGAAIKVGMEKIHKQFEAALATLKIEEIKAQGETFNPEIHEAVMQGANPEAAEDSIDLVLEKGYKIGDNVIRHSKVRVVRNG